MLSAWRSRPTRMSRPASSVIGVESGVLARARSNSLTACATCFGDNSPGGRFAIAWACVWRRAE